MVFAVKACRDGYTHYARVPHLFADLDLAHGDRRFARLFRMLVRVDLLVLDDWGPDRLSASQRRDLVPALHYEVSPCFHVDYEMPPYEGTDHRQFDLNDL